MNSGNWYQGSVSCNPIVYKLRKYSRNFFEVNSSFTYFEVGKTWKEAAKVQDLEFALFCFFSAKLMTLSLMKNLSSNPPPPSFANKKSLTRNTTYSILVLYTRIPRNSNVCWTERGILKRGESHIPIHSYTTTELFTDLLMLFGEQKCMKYYFSSDLPLCYYSKTFRRLLFRLFKTSFSWNEMVHCNWCVASQIPTQS